MKPCKSILSYGIFKASWTRCGKSALIDEIFSTDFTSNHNGNFEMRPGNPKWGGFQNQRLQRNLYDLGRIDLQLPRNIDSDQPETMWQIFDVSRFCDPEIIDFFSQKVNVIMVHVLALDIVKTDQNGLKHIFEKILTHQKKNVLFIRDIDELNKEQKLTLEANLSYLKELDNSNSTQIIKMHSFLMRE